MRVDRARLVSLLILFLPVACSEVPEEHDLLLDYLMSARELRLDSGSRTELLLRGDSLVDFLDRFERDTFHPGPRSVRIESDCRSGTLVIGRRSYPVALCTLFEKRGSVVMSIDMDTVILRMVRR